MFKFVLLKNSLRWHIWVPAFFVLLNILLLLCYQCDLIQQSWCFHDSAVLNKGSCLVVLIFLYCLLRNDDNKSMHSISKCHTVQTVALAVNYYPAWKYSAYIKNDQIQEKITNPSPSALHLPAVSVLLAIGWRGLLLALRNWLRWGITKQEQIPRLGLSSTRGWAPAGKKERSPVRKDLGGISLTDVSIPEKCIWSRFSHLWFGVFKCHRDFLFQWT